MAIKKKQMTQQQIIVDQCADAKEYFQRVYQAKQNSEDWAKDIPCDSIVYFTMICDMYKAQLLINQQRVKSEVKETA